MKPPIFLFLFLIPLLGFSQTSTLAERLGYSKDDKLLIIHADDLGVSHSENHASFTAMENGLVSSASLIVPSPWFLEVAEYKRTHPETDIGIHLALTSEWDNYKWRPVTEAPSLVDSNGYFYDNCDDLGNNATYEDVEKELRAQIDLSIANGIAPSHLDIHMGCLVFSELKYFKLYLQLGREYNIPVMVTSRGLAPEYEAQITEKDIVLDNVYGASPQDFDEEGGLAKRYKTIIRELKPSVGALIIHTAYNDSEMQQITINNKYWGAKWRQDDFDFFTSDQCKTILEEENIKLISWKEIKDKLLKE
ncbi:polysaccharide deacetylase family protein [Galbibacter sp. EGI 63066]|uniref:polysaccharide deacetylase family protein n=1 Tax=Galbibacter sp. EGI 63066 TaxID=2993559 RepID=UPI002248F827|nr:polysaccharide deacetylase family protein [Galbibacter sp. EGI 63066]MCX2680458.1 polysaccharide deacetylase family protein [Galbibacter sp. EGI 63066]